MSEPTTHYEAACRAACEWCARGWPQGEHPVCTAPTLEQFAEDRAAECERLQEALRKGLESKIEDLRKAFATSVVTPTTTPPRP
jgi:hypothetical protein